MANSNSGEFMGAPLLIFAFLFIVVYLVLILPFKSQTSLDRSEQNHRKNVKVSS